MKRLMKHFVCVMLVAAVMMFNCVNIVAADKNNDVSYSEIMADDVEGGATANIDIEAEEIFGGEKASTTIDSSSKKTDSTTKKTDTKKKTVDDTPKTGIEETSIYIPLVLVLVAAIALVIAGVNRFGRKRFNTAE